MGVKDFLPWFYSAQNVLELVVVFFFFLQAAWKLQEEVQVAAWINEE